MTPTLKTTILCLSAIFLTPVLIWGQSAKKQHKTDQQSFVISNPVLRVNFPDPTVIRVGENYYAYATNGRINNKQYNIPVAVSADLLNWKVVGDALPQKPAWATKDFWAPHILFDRKIKKYVMFYSGELGANTGKCIGVAFSDEPTGPFLDSGAPIISGSGFVNIDPFAFIDPKSGKKLLYWGSAEEPIKVQELSDDWKSFLPGSSPKNLISTSQEKKYDRLVEGAWVDYVNGTYYLYYSGDNCCGNKASYAVLVARSKSAFGPFETLGQANGTGSSVLIEKDRNWLAPGHNSVFRDHKGKVYTAYHALPMDQHTGKAAGTDRVLLIKELKYVNGWPTLVK